MAGVNQPADEKRRKISKAQQITMLEVLGASLVFGACLVVSIFLIKYIKFNTTIITEKNQAIDNYDVTLRNVGVCIDRDRSGRLDDTELDACDPNEIPLDNVGGSLRYKILMEMANNSDLELVARQRNENCFDESGERIDFGKLYGEATDDDERQRYLQSLKICSALRVIPDALPANRNTEALMASLNEIFLQTGWEPERLSPQDGVLGASEVEGVYTIPVSLRMEAPDEVVMRALDKIEKSVRQFDITAMSVEWTTSGLSLTANAFYLAEPDELEITKTLAASKKARSNE